MSDSSAEKDGEQVLHKNRNPHETGQERTPRTHNLQNHKITLFLFSTGIAVVLTESRSSFFALSFSLPVVIPGFSNRLSREGRSIGKKVKVCVGEGRHRSSDLVEGQTGHIHADPETAWSMEIPSLSTSRDTSTRATPFSTSSSITLTSTGDVADVTAQSTPRQCQRTLELVSG